ncbi:BamA/TamA family outer membrane protein [candidate division KSB1 bacterium]|nr:BamA/TamA family outer membrane protein [candidate division KSB1 bacterium]
MFFRIEKTGLFLLLIWHTILIGAGEIRISRIDFYGLESISESRAKDWFDMHEGQVFNSDQLVKKSTELLQRYKENGMAYTRIDSLVYYIAPDSTTARLALYIQEGREVRMGEYRFRGIEDSLANEMKKRINSRSGACFIPTHFERNLDDELNRLSNLGYPFGRFDLKAIRLDSVQENESCFDFAFRARTGPKLYLREIQITGNETTRDYVIRRETGIKDGELYRQDKINRIQSRLMRLGYFIRVYPPKLYWSEGNEGGLLLQIEEGPSSRFDGVLGYNPGTDEEKGYFTGLLEISLGNLLGTGRSLFVHWQKRDRKTQEMEFRYREPWVARLPFHVGVHFAQLIQDTTYIERNIAMDFELPVSYNLSAVANISRRQVTPDSVGSYILGIPSSRQISGTVGFSYDTRDDLINPQQGIYYRTSVEFGRKKNLGPETLVEEMKLKRKIDNKQYLLDLEVFIPLFARQVISFSLHGRQLKSNEDLVPLSDLYRLGGAQSLRGYREDQFLGSSVAWTNLEYRYIFGRRSRVFAFLDSGYYSRNGDISNIGTTLKVGYGIGFRLETGLGVMGIDYGLGEGDGIMNGKLHIRLVNEF